MPLAPLPPVDVSKLNVEQKVAALAADALARDDYAKRAAALLDQCSKLPEVTTKGP